MDDHETTLQRPLQRLYPLELHHQDELPESHEAEPPTSGADSGEPSQEVPTGTPQQPSRPRRAAAARARDWSRVLQATAYELDHELD